MAQDNSRGMNQPIPITGDATGTLNAATVTALQGRAINSSAPNDQDVLTWSGSQWAPTAATTTTIGVTTTSLASDYTITSTDVAIIYTGSIGTANNFLFPASATTGRVILIGNRHNDSLHSFNIKPHTGTTIDGSSTAINLEIGGAWICYDGTNWISFLESQ